MDTVNPNWGACPLSDPIDPKETSTKDDYLEIKFNDRNHVNGKIA